MDTQPIKATICTFSHLHICTFTKHLHINLKMCNFAHYIFTLITIVTTDFTHLRNLLAPLYGEQEARAMAFIVFEDAFGVSRTDIYADKVRQFSESERQTFLNMCSQLAAGEPLQYVIGHTTFCGHQFMVTPEVLIPRPETEELVDWTIETAQTLSLPHPTRLLDAGTGSGCIAISLQLAMPQAEIEAWDISPSALQVAQSNATRLQVPVRFYERDILAIDDEVSSTPLFDLIVSNPPYICQREAVDMEDNVLQHEPHTALFVPNDDPLRFYRALAHHAQRRLRSGGALLVELNRAYAEATAQLFRDMGLTHVELRRDAYGNERMCRAFR